MNDTRKHFFKITAATIANPYIGWPCTFFGLLRVAETHRHDVPPIG